MRLSAHDASFLYTETASGPMHGVVVSVLEGAVTTEEVREYYAARIHLVPRLRQKLAFVPFNLAHPKWVDDPEFDLANHIRRHKVAPNTDVKRATELALELGEPLLDRSRPLWLTYVLENVEDKTLLVQLLHHSFVDGATAVAMSTVLTDPTPDAAAPEPPPAWRPEPVPASFRLWQEAVAENAQQGVAEAQRMMQQAPRIADLTSQAASLIERMTKPVMVAPWNASLVGPKREVAILRYEVDDFRPIRKALGGTINDIVVSVVSEGAARYLKAAGEIVDNQTLRVMCPVDVRGAGSDPLDMTGNHVSAMFPLVSAQPMTMQERYSAVRAELDEIKGHKEPEVMNQLQDLQPYVPPIGMSQVLGVGTPWDPTAAAARAPLPIPPRTAGPRPQQYGFNFTCTNVPGPTWTQYVAGHKVRSVIGTLMLSGNLGLGVTVGSYAGAFTFGFTCDPRLVPDVDRFAACVAEAFTEIRALAQPTQD